MSFGAELTGGVLEELFTSPGAQLPLAETVDQCLARPSLLHSIAEGLRTGTPHVRLACAHVLLEAARQRPDLVADFTPDFVSASRMRAAKISKLGFDGLALLVDAQPSAVYAERDYLLERAAAGGSGGLAALKVVVALAAHGPNYRGKLLPPLLRLLHAADDRSLPRLLSLCVPAVAGAEESVKRLLREIEPRLATTDEATRAKLERQIAKLQRSIKRAGKSAPSRPRRS
jgi:hypothetical protein